VSQQSNLREDSVVLPVFPLRFDDMDRREYRQTGEEPDPASRESEVAFF
jgi:hypothetical protein